MDGVSGRCFSPDGYYGSVRFVHIPGHDRDRLEHLCCYIARPPLAAGRLTRGPPPEQPDSMAAASPKTTQMAALDVIPVLDLADDFATQARRLLLSRRESGRSSAGARRAALGAVARHEACREPRSARLRRLDRPPE